MAAAQVIVYAGAVMVMFLFVIAYVGPRGELPQRRRPVWQIVAAVVAAAAILAEIALAVGGAALRRAGVGGRPVRLAAATSAPLLVTDYLVAFEVVSLLLMVAAIAGVVLGSGPRPRRVRGRAQGRRGRRGAPRSQPRAARRGAGRRVGDAEGGRVTPGVVSYLGVSGVLFCIGLAGVLLRRNPLIVLLSLEVMLNSVNLSLVAFSRYLGQQDGQVFALVVMGVAAAEVVVGLGLIVAMTRRELVLDTDELGSLHG